MMKSNFSSLSVVLTIVVVVIVILCILIAFLLTHRINGEGPQIFRGGSDPPHSVGDTLHDIRKRQTAKGKISPPSLLNSLRLSAHPVATIQHHGGREALRNTKKPKPRKSWTEYKTWDALYKDEGAHIAYWDDIANVINKLDLDWGDVRAELGDKLYDNREWVGRINLVKGKPKIIELIPSPHAIGEGPLSKQASAMVPADVVAKLEAKPALFVFHTHPGEGPASTMPSPTDVAGAMHIALSGRFAADLVISPYGVFMYGPNYEFRHAVQSAETFEKAQLTLYRRVADMLAAMEGSRSWSSPWSLETHTNMFRRYDVEYVAFPTDKYAQADRRQMYTTPPGVDQDQLHYYHQRVKELEEGSKDQKIEEVSKIPKRIKRVHFAPGA